MLTAKTSSDILAWFLNLIKRILCWGHALLSSVCNDAVSTNCLSSHYTFIFVIFIVLSLSCLRYFIKKGNRQPSCYYNQITYER